MEDDFKVTAQELPAAIESILFISGDPVSVDKLADILNCSKNAILEALDPARFFRINRSCISALKAIESAMVDAGRYTVEIKPKPGEVSTVVTRSRESEFLRWLEKG